MYPEFEFRHSVLPLPSRAPLGELLLIKLLERARAAPLGNVAMIGAVASATLITRRRLITSSRRFGFGLFGVSLLMAPALRAIDAGSSIFLSA
jgi:hypothetical protein